MRHLKASMSERLGAFEGQSTATTNSNMRCGGEATAYLLIIGDRAQGSHACQVQTWTSELACTRTISEQESMISDVLPVMQINDMVCSINAGDATKHKTDVFFLVKGGR